MVKGASGATLKRLGERVQLLRRQRELTQEALAHRCGISQKYLSELERGAKTPSWDTLVALAHKGFQIQLAALMFGIDEDTSEPDRLDAVLAGRPASVRYDVLKAVRLILRAAETPDR